MEQGQSGSEPAKSNIGPALTLQLVHKVAGVTLCWVTPPFSLALLVGSRRQGIFFVCVRVNEEALYKVLI